MVTFLIHSLISVCLSAVALKNEPSNGVNKSSDHGDYGKLSESVGGRVPEGELLLQVGEQQATMLLSKSVRIHSSAFSYVVYLDCPMLWESIFSSL